MISNGGHMNGMEFIAYLQGRKHFYCIGILFKVLFIASDPTLSIGPFLPHFLLVTREKSVVMNLREPIYEVLGSYRILTDLVLVQRDCCRLDIVRMLDIFSLSLRHGVHEVENKSK